MRYHPYHAPLQPLAPSPLRRAFSLSGVLPLGAFLVLHLGVDARALWGDAAFASTIDALHRSRAVAVVETVFVLAPLLLHAAFGVWLVVTREPFLEPTPYTPPFLAAIRGTGLVAAVFVVAHLVELHVRVAGSRLDGGMLATLLTSHLSSTRFGVPWLGVGYVVGVGCVVFHFVVGCWGVYARSAHGRADRRRPRRAAVGAVAVGLLLGFGFADVVVFEATGMRLVGGRAPGGPSGQRCPDP
jgi:succinate dehydrogenase / fumarate reductase cytochrome b subunit